MPYPHPDGSCRWGECCKGIMPTTRTPSGVYTQPDEDALVAIWARYHAIDPDDLRENLFHWHRDDLYLLIRSAMVNYDRQVYNTQVLAERNATTIASLEALKP